MSEESTWKKDERPYVIFRCAKCKQYLYVKTTQQSKKCLRCGHMHKVTNISSSGETTNGLSNAIEMVKRRQNELAIKELETTPELRSLNDFKVVKPKRKDENFIQRKEINDDLTNKFKKMLIEISGMYREFPYYIIELMADNYTIPLSELKILTKDFLQQGFLIQLDDDSYKIKSG